LKHGQKTSQIRLHYKEADEDELKLIYEDNGIGIPKAEKEKVFTEGYGKDTGHGLYLMRKICQTYGWTIHETGKQDRGARFIITIPKQAKTKNP
jgi:signal transduction histidine kinase